MAGRDDSEDTLKYQQQHMQFQKLLTKIAEDRAKAAEREIQYMEQLARLTGNATRNTNDTTQRIRELNEGIGQGSQKIRETNDAWAASQNIFSKMQKAAKDALGGTKQKMMEMGKRGVVMSAAYEGLNGLKASFGALWAGAKVGESVLGGVITSIWELGKSILAIPISIFSGLVDMASQMGGDNALAQAFEDLRKEMGAFNQHEARDVIVSFRSMRGQLAETGLSVYRVFGSMAERLKEVTKLATEMGAVWHVQGDNIARNAERVMAFQKGLGLTGEAMKAIGARASAAGTDISDHLRQMATMSLQMGRSFNMSSKLISRDVGEMTKDVANFSSVGIRSMTSLSVYARKLGVEFKALLGVVDKFDNFEDAATNAAKLSQAFGLNVDAMKLMREQDPGARVEMLRKSFYATGRSVEAMTRQELKLLAATSGISEEAAKQAFALKNQGVSYGDIQRKAAVAEHRQLSQAEAMKQLASSIERLTQSGSMSKGGFWHQFVEGLGAGIKRSRDFRVLMRTLHRDLRDTWRAGRDVGRAFVDAFPGVKTFLRGISQMFERGRFRIMIRGVVSEFRTFFRAIQTDPKTGLFNLLDGLKKNFFNWFSPSSSAGSRVLAGFATFFKTLGGIAGSLVEQALKGVATGVRYITEFLRDPSAFLNSATAGGTGILAFVGEVLKPIWEGIKNSWPDLKDAFTKLFEMGWTKIQDGWAALKPLVLAQAKKYWKEIAAYFLLPMLSRSLLGGVFAAIGKTFWDQAAGAIFNNAASRGPMNAAAKAGAGGIQAAADAARTQAANVGGAMGGATPPTQETGRGLGGFVESFRGVKASDIVKMTASLLGIAAALAGGGVLMALSIVAVDKIFKANGTTLQGIVVSLGALAGAALAMVPVIYATKLIQGSGITEVAKGMAVIGGSILAMGLTLGLITTAFSAASITPSQAQGIALSMGAMGLVFMEAGAVVAIAGVIGAAVTGSSFLAGGAIAIGLGILGTVVAGMAAVTTQIISSIGALPNDRSFPEKVRVFTGLMTSISTLASKLSGFIDLVTPSFSELLLSEDTFSTKVAGVNQFIRGIIGTPTTGILGIISAIKETLVTLGSTPNLAQGAQVLGSVMTGISAALQAMMPPPEFWRTTAAWSEQAGSGNHAANLGQLRTYIHTISDAISGFIREVKGSITQLASLTISENQIKAVGAVGPILVGVGGIVQAINPPPSFWEAVSRVTNGAGTTLRGTLNSLGEYFKAVLPQVKGLMDNVKDVITQILPTLSGLTPANIKGLEAIGPVLTSISSFVQSIAGIAQSAQAGMPGGSTPDQIAVAVARQFGQMTSFMTFLKDRLPALLTSMGETMRTLVQGDVAARISPAQIKGKIESIKSMFEIITMIPAMLKGIQGDSGTPLNAAMVSRMTGGLRVVIGQLFQGGPNGVFTQLAAGLAGLPPINAASVNKLKSVSAAITSLSSALTSLKGIKDVLPDVTSLDPAQLTIGFNKVAAIINTFNGGRGAANGPLSGTEQFLSNANALKSFAHQIERVRFAHVHEVISDMVTQMNSLSAALSASLAPTINIEAHLETLAHNIGLGNSQDYTINHRNFTINMKVDVHIDTVDLKKVLLGNPNLEFQAANHSTSAR